MRFEHIAMVVIATFALSTAALLLVASWVVRHAPRERDLWPPPRNEDGEKNDEDDGRPR